MDWKTNLEEDVLCDIAISFDETTPRRGWFDCRMRLEGEGTILLQMIQDPSLRRERLWQECFPNAHVLNGRFEVSPNKRDTRLNWVLVLSYLDLPGHDPEPEIENGCRRILDALQTYQKREEGRP